MCMKPGQWLNDEVINFTFGLMQERELRKNENKPRYHFFNTFFYQKLNPNRFSSSIAYADVKKWTTVRKLGYSILDCEKLFVPIHQVRHVISA
jgi:sentrin-specific protease 1